MSSIPISKWLVMALLTALSILLGLLPYILVRYTKRSIFYTARSTKYKLTLTILSCFGAGVLLSTCMLHLLPEVRESFNGIESLWTTLPNTHFPIAEVVVISGFCLIYLVEEIAHFIMVDGHHGHHHHINTVARHNSFAHAIPIPNFKRSSRSVAIGVNRQQNLSPSICITIAQAETSDDSKISGETENYKKSSVTDSVGTSDCCMEEQCPDDGENFTAKLRTLLALTALSFHAIMEGVAIGLQNSSNVWVMFGAVASHKFVISFCMGMELVASHTKLLTYVTSISVFAVVSPIGIIIGSLLASDDATKSLPVTVIEGLACGTLLYVVFFEILNRERERKSFSLSHSKAIGFIQFLALAIGLVAMACLLIFTHDHDHGSEDEHDHEHDHSH